MSAWTQGQRTVAVHSGPTLSQTLAAEIAASSPKRRDVTRRRDPFTDYQRPAEAVRGEALRNQIRSLEATEPRNRAERRQKTAILQSLRKELNG